MEKYRTVDPGGCNLVTALQVTLAGCLGTLVWGVFKPADPSLLFVQPALLIILLNMLTTRRNWFFLLFLTTLNIAIGLFFCAILYRCRYLFLFFIFLYTYLNFVSPAYRPVGALVVILGTLNANSPGGWQHGVNNVINVFLSLGLTMFTYLITASLRRGCIRRMCGQLAQLLAEHYAEVGVCAGAVQPATPGVSAQCAALAFRLNALVNRMCCILRAEQQEQLQARKILHHARALMMDHGLLHQLPQNMKELRKIVPSTDALLADMAQRFQAAADGVFNPSNYAPVRNETLCLRWQREKTAYQFDHSEKQQNQRMLLFALECMLRDLRNYEDAIIQSGEAFPSAVDRQTEPPADAVDYFSHPETSAVQQRMLKSDYQKSALRIALAALASVFIWKAAQIQHGYWILMTTIIVYCGVNQGSFLQRSGYRLAGTFAGIILTFLFVQDFLLFNVAWAYALPVVFFLTIYFYLLTGNYGIMSLFITFFTGLMLSTLSGACPDFFLYGTLYYRMLCTTIAAVIVLVAERFIFPHILHSTTALQRTWHALVQELSDSLHTIVSRYVRGTPFSAEEWSRLTGMIEKYASTGKLHHLMQYEMRVPDQYESLYSTHKAQIDQLLATLGGLLAIASHEQEHELSDEERSRINQMSAALCQSILNLKEQAVTDLHVSETIGACTTPHLQSLLFIRALEYLAQQMAGLGQIVPKGRTS